MKSILVSGGAGFIGFHLCQALLEKGDQVICVDNLLTGQEKNVKKLENYPQFSFHHQDIALFKTRAKIDQIYNLACPASPVDFPKYPIEILQVCSAGVLNLLKLAKEKNALFLQASTSEVYGDPKVHPQPETYWGNVNPIGPRSCYDEGKRFAESLVTHFGQKNYLQTKIIRIFNTYGPNMRPDDGRVVSNFINQALEGQPLTIHGQGEQTRSFCFVTDLVSGLIKMMAAKEAGPINLGNPTEITIKNLAEKIIKITNSQSQLIFLPSPKDDPQKRRPDMGLAKKKLQWQPETALEEGLVRTIVYFRSLANGQN